MLRRLELPAQAMTMRMTQMSVVANNLANLNTTGYKRDETFVESLKKEMAAREANQTSKSVPTVKLAIDFSDGSLTETKRPLDLALSGSGLFVVETPQGEAYTRNGRFTLNAEYILTTLDGFPVLGEGGPIEINIEQYQPNEILVNSMGEVLLDGNLIDRLRIVAPEDPGMLQKRGANLFELTEEGVVQPVEKPQVRQGFLEDSNVEAVREMMTMLEILHSFEMDQKMVRTMDQILGQAREIGEYRS